MLEKAVIYARFSPRPDAAESESIAVQLDRCQAYCRMAKLEAVRTFEDPEVSARKTPLFERPSGRDMLDFIREYGIKHVVVMRLDRIFRDAKDGIVTVADFRESGTSLHFADQGGVSLCTNTAVGALVFTMLLGVAAFEPAMTAERVSKSHQFKQRSGKRVSRRPPYGWRLNPENNAMLEPVAEEQEVLGMVHEMKDKYTPTEIARSLNRWGYRMRAVCWKTRFVKKIIARGLYGNQVQEGCEADPA